MKSGNFFAELKRRNVYKVAVAYIVGGWALSQGIAQVFPVFDVPNWIIRLIVLLIIIGLPIALVLAWMFELTPGGIKRTETADAMPSAAKPKKHIWIYVVVIGALMSIGLFLLGRYSAINGAPRQDASAARTGAATVPDKSIAVLPFENLSEEKVNEFFADGVQDEILTDLAKIADLKVISRTSVMQYRSGVARNLREIGQQLGVAHLLEGSVQRIANRVRVNAQLIDAKTDVHIWAQTYDRDLADVFAIQSEIAKAIADQLQARLSPNEKAAIEKPPTTDLTAFDLYSRAKTVLLSIGFSTIDEKNLREAIELLDQAVALDPAFFEAYCQLVLAHGKFYSLNYDHSVGRLASAEAALQAVTRLRPDAGETHLARAQYLYYGHRDYSGALAELEQARRSLANDSRVFELTGYILRRRGQSDEAVRNLERSVELDPRNYFIMQQLALSYQLLRRYQEEAAMYDRVLTIVPKDVPTRVQRALVDFYWKADTKPLHDAINAILAEDPSAIPAAADTWFLCALAERDATAAKQALAALNHTAAFGEGGVYLSASFGEGLLARVTKDEASALSAFNKARAEQEKIVQTQPDSGPALCVLGLIDAALGHKEAALAEGRHAVELLPVEKDSVTGSLMIQLFAITAAWTGEKDLAVHQLELGVRTPAAGIVVTYGGLKLLPFWDPLRGDPRFEKIVQKVVAPKTETK
jgi:TolB-like protein/Tfp pilus assembly protein PilF